MLLFAEKRQKADTDSKYKVFPLIPFFSLRRKRKMENTVKWTIPYQALFNVCAFKKK